MAHYFGNTDGEKTSDDNYNEPRKRKDIMLCQPFEEKRLLKWNVPGVLCQPKLDGERFRAIISRSGCRLLSSTCMDIMSVPHIEDELKSIMKNCIPEDSEIEIDGELYIHGKDFSEIHSIVSRTIELHPDYDKMEAHIFDIINPRGQIERIEDLLTILPDLPHVKIVKTEPIPATAEHIINQLNKFTAEGYEGIIVRHPFALYERRRSPYIMKFKPKKSDVYEIVGFQEEIDKHGKVKGTLGSLICAGNDGTTFGVGTGFTANQREQLWISKNNLPGAFVKINYQSITPKHVPRFPVFVEIIGKLPY